MRFRFARTLCLVLSLLLGLGVMADGLVPAASAAAETTTYQLAELLEQKKIKPLGRTKASVLYPGGITADWSANGFEINVNTPGGYFAVGYTGNNSNPYTAVLVDGVQVWRGLTAGTGTVQIMLPAGQHKVSVLREKGHAAGGVSLVYTTVAFAGTIGERPADKELFIEVIGDSYACGSGSARDYAPGVQWGDLDHSGQNSFGWYLSKMLDDADVSIVARGGIGLTGGGEQETVETKGNILDIYPYASGHTIDEGFYDFENARKPDLVVIELGANDSISVTNMDGVAQWRSQLESMIALVRSKNGADTKILLLTHKAVVYTVELDIADKDENIWACHFSHHGNGSAALKSQKEGHPSAEDEYEIAEALYKSIQDWDILTAPAAPAEPTYTDITYYVSEDGNDESDGKTIGTAKATVHAAYVQACTDNKSFPAGSRLVLQLQGSVLYTAVGKNQALFSTTRYTADGKKLPILVTTYNYTGTKAIMDTAHIAVNGGNAAQCIYNDITFKDVTIQGTTRPHTSTTNGVTTTVYYRDRTLYGGFNDIVFDNVSFAHAVDSSVPAGQATANSSGWVITPGRFGKYDPNSESDSAKKTGSITFKNGDYTQGIEFACAVSIENYTDQTTAPGVTHKLIIEDGAIMGTVYGTYGTLPVDSATVELRGGTVNTYHATRVGKYTYKTNLTTIFCGTDVKNTNFYGTGENTTFNGNVTTEFSAGKYSFTNFYGTGKNATVTGTVTTRVSGGELDTDYYYGSGESAVINGTLTNELQKGRILANLFSGFGKSSSINSNGTVPGKLINNISGGELRCVPVASTVDAIYMGGYSSTINGNVENNISGGDVNLIYTSNVDSCIYLGGRITPINGDLVNNISGGNLFIGQNGTDRITTAGICLGAYSGSITGTHFNNITGGVFSYAVCKYNTEKEIYETSGNINMGARTVHNLTAKVKNVIGVKDSPRGPRFYGTVALGCDKGYIGDNLGKITPDGSNYSNTVVIENTVYSGYFNNDLICSTNAAIDLKNSWYSYVIGSVKTDIYGGKVAGTLYGAGKTIVCGDVTTNIYGGSFCNIYGAMSGNVYGNVTTNIEGMTELISVYNKNGSVFTVPSYKIYAAGTTATIDGNVALNIAPKAGTQLWLRTPIYSGSSSTGSVTGTTTVQIKGGIFPNGLTVDGKTVGQFLAQGYDAVDYKSGTKLAYTDTDASVAGYVEVVPSGQGSSRKLEYYVRPNGSDSDDGLSFVKAKLTVNAAIAQAVADNGSTVFPNGSVLTVYVDGVVDANSASSQQIIYGELLTTEDGQHMTTVITTYDYSDTLATVNTNHKPTAGGNATLYLCTDLYFKDVSLLSKAHYHDDADDKKDGWFCDNKLYAAGCNLTFDNASLLTDGKASGYTKWIVGADHFAVGGINPIATDEETGERVNVLNGTVTFKNGDYTNLDYVTAVNANGIWTDAFTYTDMPNIHGKVIIEDGAVMDRVFGPVGTMKVGSSTVEVRGGTVNTLRGTGSDKTIHVDTVISVSGGTVGAYYGTGDNVTVNGTVRNNISGGTVTNFSGTGNGTDKDKMQVAGVETTITGGTFNGKWFLGAGNHVIVNGTIRNTISDGSFTIIPVTNNQKDAYFFAGREAVTANGVANTISGGTFQIVYDNNYDSAFYFGGGPSAEIKGDVTNILTGGTFQPMGGKAAGKNGNIYLGQYGGQIHGTLRNEIGAIVYDCSGLIEDNNLYCGPRATKSPVGKIVNIIGDEETGTGPQLKPNSGKKIILQLGSGWCQAGCSTKLDVADDYPAAEDAKTATQNVVIESTIYGGTFPSDVYGSPTGAMVDKAGKDNGYYNIAYGSAVTNIYGGSFNNFYGAGTTTVFGHVTTNIYGGTFTGNIFGSNNGIVYDGVELNIYGLDEGCDPAIYAGGTSATISVATDGRDAVKLNIAPTGQLVHSNTISAGFSGSGTATGTTSVSVSGGTYTKGLKVAGVTAKNALAEGCALIRTADKAIVPVAEKATSSGTESVTVIPAPTVDKNLKFSNASLSLQDDLGVNFKANSDLFTAGNFTDPHVLFRFNGADSVNTEYFVKDGKVVFRFWDIAPHLMNETITATLYGFKDGKLYMSEPAEYSVRKYCDNMLGRYNDVEYPDSYGELRTLLVDLMNYGAAAQQYMDHKTDALVNAHLIEKQLAWGTQTEPAAESILNLQHATVENPSVTWHMGTLVLNDSVMVRYTLAASSLEGLTVKVQAAGREYVIDGSELKATGTQNEAGVDCYTLDFDKLNAAQMREQILVTAYVGETPVSNTVSYSIESYVADNKSTDAKLNALVKSMLRYGDAAYAFVK